MLPALQVKAVLFCLVLVCCFAATPAPVCGSGVRSVHAAPPLTSGGDVPTIEAPEPAVAVLIGSGLVLFGVIRRRRAHR